MYTHVFCEATLTNKTFTTQNAGIWIGIIVSEHMSFQSPQATERHITHITVIWSLLSMCDFMMFPIILNGKLFVTNITFEWTHFTMNTLTMEFHINPRSKCFFTHITAIWTITTVYALKMLLQITQITTELITHTAREWTLSSMQALMFLQITLIIE
jgi:hypothetical protein